MASNEHLITSEIHPFTERVNSEPVVSSQNVVSRFIFTLPAEISGDPPEIDLHVDDDGDYIIQRKLHDRISEGIILIEHTVSTTLGLVGQQIWRGSLLLADFILHNGSALFKAKLALELGSGTGLSGIVSALFCSEVICTDINRGNILDIIKSNAKRNANMIGRSGGKIDVEELDFFNKDWNESLKIRLKNTHIILAADVIYDNDLSEAFVDTLCRLMVGDKKKVAYLAMEKRYVFTMADQDSVAPCYEHFLVCLRNSPLWPHATSLPVDFPQYFNYERGKDLVLWRISGV